MLLDPLLGQNFALEGLPVALAKCKPWEFGDVRQGNALTSI